MLFFYIFNNLSVDVNSNYDYNQKSFAIYSACLPKQYQNWKMLFLYIFNHLSVDVNSNHKKIRTVMLSTGHFLHLYDKPNISLPCKLLL